jgi:hypothetical protein
MEVSNVDAMELDPGTGEQPAWPKAVGITSIVWGSFWLLCGGCGLAWFGFQGQFMKMAEQSIGEPFPAVLSPPPMQLVVMAFGLLLSGLLILAGVLTLGRKPAGRPLHLAYAGLSFISLVASVIVGVQQIGLTAQWVRDNPTSKWAAQIKPELSMVMMIVFTILAALWPLFCVVWFGFMRRDPSTGARPPAVA